MIVTGAAPVSPAVLGFLRAALGCQVLTLGGLSWRQRHVCLDRKVVSHPVYRKRYKGHDLSEPVKARMTLMLSRKPRCVNSGKFLSLGACKFSAKDRGIS